MPAYVKPVLSAGINLQGNTLQTKLYKRYTNIDGVVYYFLDDTIPNPQPFVGVLHTSQEMVDENALGERVITSCTLETATNLGQLYGGLQDRLLVVDNGNGNLFGFNVISDFNQNAGIYHYRGFFVDSWVKYYIRDTVFSPPSIISVNSTPMWLMAQDVWLGYEVYSTSAAKPNTTEPHIVIEVLQTKGLQAPVQAIKSPGVVEINIWAQDVVRISMINIKLEDVIQILFNIKERVKNDTDGVFPAVNQIQKLIPLVQLVKIDTAAHISAYVAACEFDCNYHLAKATAAWNEIKSASIKLTEI